MSGAEWRCGHCVTGALEPGPGGVLRDERVTEAHHWLSRDGQSRLLECVGCQ